MSEKLTHLDEQGRARMVDVGHKPDTERIAVARGEIHMKKETLDLIRAGQIKKGDVLTVAQIAGKRATQVDTGNHCPSLRTAAGESASVHHADTRMFRFPIKK